MEQERIFRLNRDKLVAIVMSIFQWEMPDTMNPKIFEQDLLIRGSAAGYWEEKFGCFINTMITGTGGLDIYGMPRAYNCLGVGYTREMPSNKIAWCLNSISSWGGEQVRGANAPFIPIRAINYYAELLTSIDIAIENNINANKNSTMIVLDDNSNVKTANKAFEQATAGKPVIICAKSNINGMDIKSFDIGHPIECDKLQTARKNVVNDFLSTFGINNLSYEKKAQMISDETRSNEDCLSLTLQNFYIPRLEFIDRFYKLYGITIRCKPAFLNSNILYNDLMEDSNNVNT